MKEIGGYLEFELKFEGREYHEHAIRLNLARNAVLYLLETKKYKKIYLPFFLCDCIENLLKKENIFISYYRVDQQCRPVFEEALESYAAIWIVNYYGQLSKEEIQGYKMKWDRIILDNTQDFFSLPVSGVDTVYNARKYFGIADGGYLYTDQKIERTLEQAYSYNRLNHIVGRFEKSANEFYSEFIKSEESFNFESLKGMSLFSNNILKGIDYKKTEQIRTENYSYLAKRLSKYNEWKLRDTPGTYMYPFLHVNAKEIRRKLLEDRIYIPLLWPNVVEKLHPDMLEYQLAENILPLPIDQRYNLFDMKYLVDKLIEIL